MKMSEIREMATVLGLEKLARNKAESIRMIQRAEGNPDCFGSATDYCDQQECAFIDDCLGSA